jgi:hypothetical protein
MRVNGSSAHLILILPNQPTVLGLSCQANDHALANQIPRCRVAKHGRARKANAMNKHSEPVAK